MTGDPMNELILLTTHRKPQLTPNQLTGIFAPLADAAPPPSEKNPARVYLKSLKAGGGRRGMESQLKKIALSLGFYEIEQKTTRLGTKTRYVGDIDRFPWPALDYAMVRHLVDELAEAVDAGTVNLRTARLLQNGLRGVSREAFNLELMPADTLMRIMHIRLISGSLEESGRALPFEELQALIDLCKAENSVLGVRDKAIIALGYGCGLRRGELAAARFEDYKAGKRALQVMGKGRKQNTIPVPPNTAAHLEEWLDLRGYDTGPLWFAVTPDNRIARDEQTGLTDQAIYEMLLRRARQARIESCTPHDLRRTYVTTIIGMTDLATAQHMARHANLGTTALYDKAKEKKGRDTSTRLPVPL